MTIKELCKTCGITHISVFLTRIKNVSIILSIGIILCTASILVITPQQASSQTFAPAVNLSNDSDESGEPSKLISKRI